MHLDRTLTAALIAAGALLACTVASADAPATTLVIRAARLVDAEKGTVIPNGVVVVSGERITSAGAAASAQSFPNRPLRLVVPYAPGGVLDFTGRQVAKTLGEL